MLGLQDGHTRSIRKGQGGKCMRAKTRRPLALLLAAMALLGCLGGLGALSTARLPQQLRLTVGGSGQLTLGWPLELRLAEDSAGVLRFDGETLPQGAALPDGDVRIEAVGSGQVTLSAVAFGCIALQDFTIQVGEQRVLIPGGQCVGAAVYAQVLVVGLGEVTDENGMRRAPAREAGVQPGDIVSAVNGQPVTDAAQLSESVSRMDGKTVDLTLERKSRELTVTLTPARDKSDGGLRLGMWTRDSTAGVGTLTYYDPKTGSFGSLGHAITDPDTGSILELIRGEIYRAQILDVRKGEQGMPGELKGNFDDDVGSCLGSILQNTAQGIFGRLEQPTTSSLYPQGLQVCPAQDVETGTCSILATVGETVQEYTAELLYLQRDDTQGRDMVVRITDPALLEATGGIVQGMSGSPIVQHGQIIGAITHVFVNDATKGYGIFIERMLERTDSLAVDASA